MLLGLAFLKCSNNGTFRAINKKPVRRNSNRKAQTSSLSSNNEIDVIVKRPKIVSEGEKSQQVKVNISFFFSNGIFS